MLEEEGYQMLFFLKYFCIVQYSPELVLLNTASSQASALSTSLWILQYHPPHAEDQSLVNDFGLPLSLSETNFNILLTAANKIRQSFRLFYKWL